MPRESKNSKAVSNPSSAAANNQSASGISMPAVQPFQLKANNTGLPDNLKSGIENLSGYSLDDVKVHYNSSQPAALQAHAYAQGTDIHVSPGQERHLPHEAWHIVQQKQGRVKPTIQLKDGAGINDDAALEQEAEHMGIKAVQQSPARPRQLIRISKGASSSPYQLVRKKKKSKEERKKEFYERMRRSKDRNKTGKARPRRYRAMYNIQRDFNYGFRAAQIHKRMLEAAESQALVPYNPLMNPDIKPQHTQVDFGGVNAYFYQFYGGQPFFRLDTESFDNPTIKSNYDEIIENFNGKDAEVAFDILQTIETNKGLTTDIQGQARALMIFLTQVIEAHSTRIPGADKLARALLRRIALGQLTFKQAFNRKNGLFVSAWSKGAGATKGGQIAARAMFGMSREKDKYEAEDLEKDLGGKPLETLMETVEDYYSDDSDEEGEEEDKQDYLTMNSLTIKSVNDALGVLGLSLSVTSSRDLLKLPAYEKEINDSYRKLSAKYHPDKQAGVQADSQKFTEVAQAAGILRQWVSELKDNKLVDMSGKELNALMERNGLRLEKVDGNGNCFYAAVLDQIRYHGGLVPSAQMLRDRIAQLILDNANTFQVFVTGNQLNQIVESILTNHSWNNAGGDFAPQLIASVLRRPVRIIQPDGVIDMAPRNDLTLTPHNTLNTGNSLLTIAYNGNNHYDSTRQNMLS